MQPLALAKYIAAAVGTVALIVASKMGMSDSVLVPVAAMWTAVVCGHVVSDQIRAHHAAKHAGGTATPPPHDPPAPPDPAVVPVPKPTPDPARTTWAITSDTGTVTTSPGTFTGNVLIPPKHGKKK